MATKKISIPNDFWLKIANRGDHITNISSYYVWLIFSNSQPSANETESDVLAPNTSISIRDVQFDYVFAKDLNGRPTQIPVVAVTEGLSVNGGGGSASNTFISGSASKSYELSEVIRQLRLLNLQFDETFETNFTDGESL